jgi:hypothetical protein
MRHASFAPICGAAILAAGLFTGSPHAHADDCALAMNAAIAQAKVPHADSHVSTAPGKPPVTVELIFLGDKVYTQTNGTWRSMDFSAQQQIDMVNALNKRTEQMKHSCQKLASDPIDGEAAFLLVMHSEDDGKVSDARIWISDKTGMPLKSEIHLSSGTVVTDAFRYGDIKAPAGVQ